ncbi:MAG: ribosome recycling factor [Candidatus Woykebacteria bacterium]
MEQLISDTKQKMQKALEHLRSELSSVRTGRANPGLVEQLKVEAYGSTMPLRDLSSINAPEPRLLIVQPWDAGNTAPIVKALRDSGLGLNPAEENNVIRVPIPALTEERRRELVKVVHEKVEDSKVAVRGVRREVMEKLEKDEKGSLISKDERHRYEGEVQKAVDEVIKEIDQTLKFKETELSQI